MAAVQAQDGRISRAASMELPSGVITDGEVADVERLTESLKTFFKENDLPTRVRLGVSNQQIVVRHLELPLIEEQAELAAAVRFQAAEAIAMPLDEAVLDYQVVGQATNAEGSPRLRVVVVAARQAMIERFVEGVRAAGLKPEGIDLNAFALVRALAKDEAAQAAATADEELGALPVEPLACVYCHLGGVTNLAVAVGTSCLFTRPLSTDWSDEGELVAAALAEEIRLSIDFYMAQPDARPVGEVQLSGPGSAIDGLAEELKSLIHLPVSVADPLGGLDANGALNGEDPHRHTVAAGLALGAAA
ncbi:MAG TPA: pilus assembly protein PilM [Thermoleophilaceae bacterium]|nr:pilus assembly protein PilM [Thermoleophilaceae bacterium]